MPIWHLFFRTRVWSLTTLVIDSLTVDCCLDLIELTLTCEDADSKVVADVNAEKRVDDSLVHIWKLMFGQ